MTNLRLQKIVVITAILLFILKIIAWWFTHSVAVLTDALEGIVNVVSGLVGWFSLALSAKPKDENHPYGHGKVEFVSAALEGLFMCFAGIFIIYESITSFFTPRTIHQLDLGLILISITAIVNFALGAWCIKKGKATHSLALQASGKHLQTDTLTTVGILVGLALISLTGWLWLDGAVALLFGIYILYTAIVILRAAMAGIMDEADESLIEQILLTLNANRRENWIDIHNLRIIKYGEILHIDAHLTVPWFLNVNEAHAEIDRLQALFAQTNRPIELFIHTDGCIPASCAICTQQSCAHRQKPHERTIVWTVQTLIKNQRHQYNSV